MMVKAIFGQFHVYLLMVSNLPKGALQLQMGRGPQRGAHLVPCRFLMPCDETIYVQKQSTAGALQEHQYQICTIVVSPNQK